MRVAVSQTQIKDLKALQEKTGLEPKRVVTLAPDDFPKDIKGGTIKRWIQGKEKLAPYGYVDAVIAHWSLIPEEDYQVPITEEMIAKLHAYQKASNCLLYTSPSPRDA